MMATVVLLVAAGHFACTTVEPNAICPPGYHHLQVCVDNVKTTSITLTNAPACTGNAPWSFSAPMKRRKSLPLPPKP